MIRVTKEDMLLTEINGSDEVVDEAGSPVGKQAESSSHILPLFFNHLPLPFSLHPMPSSTATVTMTLQPTPNIVTNGYTNVHSNGYTNGVRKFRLDPIPEALAAFQKGEFLVVVDDESRENEGDLIIAASHITTQKMAWFIKHTSCVFSFICAPSV